MSDLIPVYRPDLSGNEMRYVMECLESTWISSIGRYINQFETAVADFTGSAHAVSVCNGTVALHLALHCLDIGPGDEVIVPSFTYIASVNTIAQTGATPVFAESRIGDWLLDPADVEGRITPRTKAIMAVHLYGACCDMAAINDIARRYDIKVIEDCAEALGSHINGQHAGTFGDVGTFSFFGNKTVTTGEGGLVLTNDANLASRLRMTKGQGQSLTRRYWHEVLGFNYRMTNIAAAIGVAQMERLPQILERKRQLADSYRDRLAGFPVTFQERRSGVQSSEWLVSLLLPEGSDRGRVMDEMKIKGVDTRPVFFCAHDMPMYAQTIDLPAARSISSRGLSLPSYPALSGDEISRVVKSLQSALSSQGLL